MKNIYTIYSHEDTDGGIAAAIFLAHLNKNYAKYGWTIEVVPVSHSVSFKSDWSYQEIIYPCAILDFSLHAQFMNERFFLNLQNSPNKDKKKAETPPCYWIDHHPTGSTYNFLTENNVNLYLKDVVCKWDTKAISTPGLLRTHYESLNLPRSLIENFEEFIDIAEIVDGALYASAEEAHNFSDAAIKLQTLFSCSHPFIDKKELYKKLVHKIAFDNNLENLFDSDILFSSLIKYEEHLHAKQYQAYKKYTTKIGNIAYANFYNSKHYDGMSRFLPYLLYPDVEYAIHILPKTHGHVIISCGINPWNKPMASNKHLGNYFAKNFGGGGHSFVAGAKISDENIKNIDKLIQYLQD